jgi:histidine triad (HIT) family protein
MYNHAPDGYDCLFCKMAAGIEDTAFYNRQSDVFYRTDHITAMINPRWWPNINGNVLIVPNQHIENIYNMSPELHMHIYEAARQVAIAFKQVYGCEGVSTRQHNEPAGLQEIFHYHVHVFPRYKNDYLYDLTHQHRWTTPEERLPYALKLKAYFDGLHS